MRAPATAGVFASTGAPHNPCRVIVDHFDDGEPSTTNVEPHPALAELAALCRCGHERGDHLEDGSHMCDVRKVHQDGSRELVDVCLCRGFEALRQTERMRELARPCACGHARQEHADDSPHACHGEGSDLASCACRSFTAAEPLHEREP